MRSIPEIVEKIEFIGIIDTEQVATYEEGFLDALMWVLKEEQPIEPPEDEK